MENWMTESINEAGEAPLAYEEWMLEPLNKGLENTRLENWMTKPFYAVQNEQVAELESWMTIPFATEEQSAEEEPVLEKWMTQVFTY